MAKHSRFVVSYLCSVSVSDLGQYPMGFVLLSACFGIRLSQFLHCTLQSPASCVHQNLEVTVRDVMSEQFSLPARHDVFRCKTVQMFLAVVFELYSTGDAIRAKFRLSHLRIKYKHRKILRLVRLVWGSSAIKAFVMRDASSKCLERMTWHRSSIVW